jgi:hypothetical protein
VLATAVGLPGMLAVSRFVIVAAAAAAAVAVAVAVAVASTDFELLPTDVGAEACCSDCYYLASGIVPRKKQVPRLTCLELSSDVANGVLRNLI